MQTSLHELRDAERVERVADGVTRRFVAKGNPIDSQDIFQEAALAAVEVLRRGNLREGENPAGCMYVAARRTVRNKTMRLASVVSLTDQVLKYDDRTARRLQRRVSLSRPRREEGEDSPRLEAEVSRAMGRAPSPEDRLLARERARAADRLRLMRRRRAERYLMRMPEEWREAVELLLGWDGRNCSGEKDAARMVGISVKQVERALSTFRSMAWDDIELRRLQRRLEAIEE